MLMRKLSFVFCCFLILYFSTIESAYSDNSINIGVIGPMKYSHGQETWNAAVLASDQINRQGGVRVGQNLMPIKIIKVDSDEYLSVTTAVSSMEMLLFKNKVDFVVGGFRSEAVLAMQDVAMDHKKIFFSSGAAAPELTQRVAQNYSRYKYYFRLGTFNNYDLGKACFLQLGYVAQILKKRLGLRTIKVAIAAENTTWVEGLIEASKLTFPKMGLELVGIFRPSSVAMDVEPTIKAIAQTHAPIVFTLFSTDVGIAFAAQATDNKLPAVLVGINAEAQKIGFWEATDKKANYLTTITSFAPEVEMSPRTKEFIDQYQQNFDDIPGYTAGGTYTAIAGLLAPAIEQAGSLDPDQLVEIIESQEFETPYGITAFEKDELNRQLHDTKFGVDYALPIAIQWQNGHMKGIWPNNYQETPDSKPFSYKGIVDYKVPERVIKEYKAF